MAEREHIRLGLGIVVRVVGREENDAAAVDPAEAGRGIGHCCRMITVTMPCEEPASQPAHEWGAVQAFFTEAGADNHVCIIGGKRFEQPTKLARIVLAVAVDLDGHLEAVVPCVLVSRLDRRPDSDVVREVARLVLRRAQPRFRVPSVDPSSTTRISNPGSKERISSTTRAIVGPSFKAGTIASRRTVTIRSSWTAGKLSTSALTRVKSVTRLSSRPP